MANCVLKLRRAISQCPLLLRSSFNQYNASVRYLCSVSISKTLLEQEQPSSKKTKVKTNFRQENAKRSLPSPAAQEDSNSLFNVDLNNLETQINRKGRIFSHQYFKIFEKLLKSNDKQNYPRYSLFLIRCCGNVMMDLSEKEKINFVHTVWKEFEKRETKFDISHYNALLKVYTENHHMFDHKRLLSSLKFHNIQPNRTTYQRMIADCCSRGKVEEAKVLRSKMTELGMAPSEAIFQSLIVGHAKAGDIETALSVPNEMRELGIVPGADIHQAIMTVFAETRNVDGIMEIKEKMEQEGLNTDESLLKIIESLAVDRNNKDFCPQVLSILKSSQQERSGTFPLNVADTVQSLCYKEHYDIAFQVTGLCDYSSKPTALFITCMLADGPPQCSEEIAVEYLDRIGSEYPLVYITALNKMILSKKFFDSGLIEKTLEKIAEKNVVINDAMFNQIVRRCVHMNDLKLAKKMVNLFGHGKKMSFSGVFLVPIREFILKSSHIMDAVDMLEEIFPIIEIDSKRALSLLVSEIINYFRRQNEMIVTNSAPLASKLFNILVDRGMKVECTPGLLKFINSSLLSYNSIMLMTMLMDPKDVEQLIEQERADKSKGDKHRMNMLTILSCVYGFNGNCEKAVEVKKDISPANNKNLGTISDIAIINAHIMEGNFNIALELCNKFESELKMLFTVFTRCIELLAKTGKLQEALEFIKKLKGQYPQLFQRMPFPKANLWPLRIQRLMDQGCTSQAEAILDAIIAEGYPAENYSTSIIAYSYLKRNNVEAAVSYLERVCEQYQILPSNMDILKASLKVRDTTPELFERVFKCCQVVYDSHYLMHKLAFALVEIGYFEEAKDCIKLQKFQWSFVRDKLEKYALTDNRECIQNTLNLIKSTRHLDWDNIYFTLIKAYGKVNNWRRCLELWQEMQKEEILTRKRTLNFLAGILEMNQQPVPFYVPSI